MQDRRIAGSLVGCLRNHVTMSMTSTWANGITHTLKFEITMDEPNTMHPPDSTTDLTPYTTENAFAELGPCSVGVDEGEEVAAREVGEDEDMVCWCGEVSEERCYVWVGYVLDDR